MSSKSTSFGEYLNKIETFLEEYLVKKAPSIPENGKNAIVQFLPWIMIVVILFAVTPLLALTGLLAPAAFLGGFAFGFSNLIFFALSIVMLVMEGMAIPHLLKKQERGWRLLFYASLLGVVTTLFGTNYLSGLIFNIIGLYILFQIREKYR